MARLCRTPGCQREAVPNWAYCSECRDRILYPPAKKPLDSGKTLK